MTVPTDRDHASVVALVECALVELTHETVGAAFVSRQVGRSTRTQYVAGDDVGEQFQKRRFDDRLGWHETTIPRRAVRDEPITHPTRSASTASGRWPGVGASVVVSSSVVLIAWSPRWRARSRGWSDGNG